MGESVYKPASKSFSDRLEQGDILKRSNELVSLLRTYHPYYADHHDNKYFIVLTQSCDLVPRNGSCKARYISLAPMRPLKSIIQREFQDRLKTIDVGDPYGSTRLEAEVEQFLTRLFNNNETSYFCLEANPQAKLFETTCAVLALSIALKAEHYNAFLASRITGIDDTFQAKLGWLVGQLYSRVGTPDMYEGDAMKKKVGELTKTMAVWLPPDDVDRMEKLIAEERAGGRVVDDFVFGELHRKLPRKKQIAVDVILKIASEAMGWGEGRVPERHKLRTLLNNDASFGKLF